MQRSDYADGGIACIPVLYGDGKSSAVFEMKILKSSSFANSQKIFRERPGGALSSKNE
jgi:hypothetical protein